MSDVRTKVEIGGVVLHLGEPDSTDMDWIGQDEVLRQLSACWLVVDSTYRWPSPRYFTNALTQVRSRST